MTRQEWRAKVTSDAMRRGLGVSEAVLPAHLCDRLQDVGVNPRGLEKLDTVKLAETTGEMFEEVFLELTRLDWYLKRLSAKDLLAVALYEVQLVMPAVERLLDLSAAGEELDAEVEKALDYVRAAWMNR